MAEAAEIKTKITADSRKFVEEAIKAKKEIKSLAEAIEKEYGVSAKEANSIAQQSMRKTQESLRATKKEASLVKDAFVAMASVLSVTTIVATLKHASEQLDDMAASATKLGVSVEAFQGLEYAAKRSDVEIGTLEMTLKKLSLNLAKSPEAFSKLGLSARQLRDMSLDKAFEKVSAAIANIKDPAERSKQAVSVFGRSAQEAMTLIRSNIKDTRKEFESLGVALSDEDLKAFDKMDEATDKVATTIKGSLMQAVVALSPAITSFANGLVNSIKYAKELANSINSISPSGNRSGVVGGALDLTSSFLGDVFGNNANSATTTYLGKASLSRVSKSKDYNPSQFANRQMGSSIPSISGSDSAMSGISVPNELRNLATAAGAATAALQGIATGALDKFKALLGIQTDGLGKSYLQQNTPAGMQQAISATFNTQLGELRDIIAGGGTAGFGGSLDQRIADLRTQAENMGGNNINARGEVVSESNSGALAAVALLEKAAKELNSSVQKPQEVSVKIEVDKDGLMRAFTSSGNGTALIQDAAKKLVSMEASAVGS